ncbi:MAG TPA: DNA translocase FtsK [Solirubrobacterales bacterium]
MASTRKRPAKGRGKPTRTRAGREELDRARDAVRRGTGRLEQRHYDVIGLALVAAALYLGFVLYLDSDGGRVGEALTVGIGWTAGAAGYAFPILLAGAGLALIVRPFLPSPGALNAGAGFIVCGLLLAFAAQTAGLGPERPVRHEYFDPNYFEEHGGAFGEALYWSASTLFQDLGAHIIAVLFVVAGLLLATGGSIAGGLRGAGRFARTAGATAWEFAGATRELSRETRDFRRRRDEAWGPDEPDDTEIAITRAAQTEALETQALAAADEDPAEIDLFAAEDEPDEAADGEERGGFADTGSERLAEIPEDDEAEVTLDDEPPEEIPAPDTGLTPMGKKRSAVTESEEIDYKAPPAKLLERGKASDKGPDTRDREATSKALLEALGHFGVDAKLVGVVSGPHVSRYELQLAPGTKVGKVAQLKDDLAYALASTDIRILAPIPGKRAVGVEVPNARRRLVRLGDIYKGRPKGSSPMVGWLGKDVSGQSIACDVAMMPHLLVAGTTGSGKSGCVNAILTSILMSSSPNEVRMVLVDPKRVELNHYDSIPHLLTPVVTSPRMAANVLANLIGEMESRYGIMGEARARNLVELNRIRKRKGEAPLPYILCIIDELADLMMVAPAEVEDAIIRLAQKSRAVGIHLILATQRPSTDIITGTIKVNIPARIAFAVASQVDSRVILDQGGAESLLGQGDMLFRGAGTSKMARIQGAFVTEDEIARVTKHWSRQGEPDFDAELLEAKAEPSEEAADGDFSPDQDDLLEDAVRIVVETDTASVSMIQRRLRVGYTRAGRLIDMLERRGVISGYEGSKPRQVLISAADIPRVLGGSEPAPETEPEPAAPIAE